MVHLGPLTFREVNVHPEDEYCQGHCTHCDLDERGAAWTWCLECGHGYRTEADLVAAYRKQLRAVSWWRWLRSYFESGHLSDRIFSCPLCGHDF